MMEIHRSYFYYREKRDDTDVEEAIRAAAEHGDGFWKIFGILRRDGKLWNHKKVYRVYKSMHYEKRSRLKKRLPARVKNPLEQPLEPNTTWSIDFVSDMLECGRKFRVLNIIDDSDRVAVAQEVSMSFPSRSGARVTTSGCCSRNPDARHKTATSSASTEATAELYSTLTSSAL